MSEDKGNWEKDILFVKLGSIKGAYKTIKGRIMEVIKRPFKKKARWRKAKAKDFEIIELENLDYLDYLDYEKGNENFKTGQ